MNRNETLEQVKDFVELQLQVWPEAKERYVALGSTERKRFRLGRVEGAIQFNPSRARSTTADITATAIEKRPCFLCEKNRPEQQIKVPILKGWTMLLNPFPIFPIHFTIASDNHEDQKPNVGKMIEIAEKLPGLVVFFNGARAGASAPDHLHFQAVLSDELPLPRELEKEFNPSESTLFQIDPEECGNDADSWPFAFRTAVIYLDHKGQEVIGRMMKPSDTELLNQYVWVGERGELRILDIPRRAHRPECYTDPRQPVLVSPGAIDMAGIVITVRPEDFDKAPDVIEKVFQEVAFGK